MKKLYCHQCYVPFFFMLLFYIIAFQTKELFSQDFWQECKVIGTGTMCLQVNSDNQLFAGTYGSYIHRSNDEGASWIQLKSGLANDKRILSLATKPGGYIFAGTESGGVYRSIDNGANWTYQGLSPLKVQCIAINSSGTIFLGTYIGGLFRSQDNGEHWGDLVGLGISNHDFQSIVINASGHVFVGTFGGGIFRSINNGDNFVACNNNLTNLIVYSTAINSVGTIFVGTAGGVFRSSDNGDSWTQINTDLTSYSINAIAINKSDHVFAGTPGGVFRSIDNGDNWTKINAGLSGRIYSLVINSSDIIFAGATTAIFRSIQPTTAINDNIDCEPLYFSLAQNYPNPFNPSTIIQYSIPKASQVELKIFDLLGRELKVLVTGKQEAGSYQVQFDSQGLPAGLYFYRLRAGKFCETKKMVIVK
ncbi:MAG TPA: T9SS type A sorting domain-containing protein [bacterium]